MRSQVLRIIGADAANIVGFHVPFDGIETRHVMYRCHEKAIIQRVPSGDVLCHITQVKSPRNARGKKLFVPG